MDGISRAEDGVHCCFRAQWDVTGRAERALSYSPAVLQPSLYLEKLLHIRKTFHHSIVPESKKVRNSTNTHQQQKEKTHCVLYSKIQTIKWWKSWKGMNYSYTTSTCMTLKNIKVKWKTQVKEEYIYIHTHIYIHSMISFIESSKTG